ncbi:MAG: hypothetical protein LBC40_06240, partial [Dysgonamonadaceae bacterium]|nr:hypothetical protein [Dysgonamonadaceae bacterium]
MKFSTIGYFLLFIAIATLSSCRTTKYVPGGEYLLDKVHIHSDHPDFNAISLQTYIRQRPNYKMFGLNKTQLQIYSLSGKDSTKWINRQLRRLGEAPVIYDSVLVYKTEAELEKLLINKGYLHAEVNSSVNKQRKKAEVTYFIHANKPYLVSSFTTLVEDTAVYETLAGSLPASSYVKKEPSSSETSPLIKPGSLFDRNTLDSERQRITDLLRNKGYYAFNKDFLSYLADTSAGNRAVDLQLVLRPFTIPARQQDQKKPHSRYWIDKVYIYADYDPLRYGGITSYTPADTIQLGDYTIYYGKKGQYMRPKVLLERCFITPGNLYETNREELTYSAFSGLKALENTNVYFREKARNDTNLLDCYILAVPAKKQTSSTSLEGTNSEGNLGFATSWTYQHRNIFRGSETFGVKLTGAYESISENFSDNYLDLGIQTTLTFPKIVLP